MELWKASDWLKNDKKQLKVMKRRQTRVYLGFTRPTTGTMRFGPMAGLVGCAFDLIVECTCFWPLPFEKRVHNRTRVSCSFYSGKKYTSRYLVTVQQTANSSAWKHIFNFQRRGPTRRSCKELSPCRTHESAPRSPYLRCQTMVQRQQFGARDELRSIPQEKMRGRGASSCRLDCLQKFFGGNATQVG